MMLIVIWSNFVVLVLLLYAFCELKGSENKSNLVRIKVLLVIIAATGIVATFGRNLIYLLTSGLIAWAALEKGKPKGDEGIRLDS